MGLHYAGVANNNGLGQSASSFYANGRRSPSQASGVSESSGAMEPLDADFSTGNSVVVSAPGDVSAASNDNSNVGVILEQDRFLPIANINRIMKSVLPAEGKLSKEAKECVQECITEFLLFITSEASEKCTLERRKTITGDDLLVALQTLGFDDYVEPLREFLQKYRDANRVTSSIKDGYDYDTLAHHDSMVDRALIPCASSTSTVVYQKIGPSNSAFELEQQQDFSATANHHFEQQQIYSANVPTTITSRTSPMKSVHQQQMAHVPQVDSDHQQQQLSVPNTLQPMQIFVDASTGQHYVCTQSADGTQNLLAVNLTPAALPAANSSSVPSSTSQIQQQPASQSMSTATPPLPSSTSSSNMGSRKRALGGRPSAKKNATSNGTVATGMEQSVRHFLQSQPGFKIRKTPLDK